MSDNAQPHDLAHTETAIGSLRMLAAGAKLAGRYRILGVAGAGGMGVVYQAHDEDLDTPVALKALRPERRPDAAALARFRDEIRLARKVSHPAVVRIHDIGQDGDIVFFTMDLVEGRTLRELLADGPLPADRAAKIARRLAEGLAAAHEQGVVHRDLKPENILASDDGRAWLSDFGIARAIGSERVTRDGHVAGTPDYLSPEQVRGESVDGRADIYALGLVLYEMLAGGVPLRGDTVEETAAQRAAGRSADLRALERAPKGLRRIVAKCLEPNPADRYATASELAKDLESGDAKFRATAALKWGAAALLLLLIGVALWPSPRVTAPGAASESAVRVAVLPLGNFTGRSDYDWVRRGLSESLATKLAESPEIQVVESLRVFQTMDALGFSEEKLDAAAMRQLAALLDVSEIVTGGVIGDEQSLRLELTMRSQADGGERHVRVPVGSRGLLPAADDSVSELRALLKVPARDVADAADLPDDVAAMTAYDEGVALLARGETVAAIGPLEKSTAAAPEFGLGWSALARAYADAGRHDKAQEAADKAVALFQGQGGRAALQARAQRAILAGDLEEGVALLQRLTQDFPNDPSAKAQLAEQLGELGRLDEAQELLKGVVGADPNHPRAWFLLAKFAIIEGDARTAVDDYLVRALVIQNRLDSPQGRGETFNAMGIAHEQLGELDIARQYYRNAAETRAAAGDQRGLAGTLSNIARLDMIQGDFEAARAELGRSLDVLQSVGDTAGVANMRNELGVLEEEAGNYAAARDHYRAALQLRQSLGENLDLAESYANLAFTYLTLGEYDNAAVFANSALEKYDAADNERGRLSVLEIEGKLGIARGDWDGALRAFVKCLELSKKLDNPFSQAVAEGGLGRVAHYQGRPKAALDAWARALELLKPLEDLRGIAEYELSRADLLLALNLPEEARAVLDSVAPWLPDEGSVDQKAEYQRLAGILASMDGKAADALSHFDTARALVEQSGSAALALRMDLARLRWLKDGPAPDPESLVDRAARLGDAPMRLEAAELLAAARLAAGEREKARDAARSALRPPVRREQWFYNWRLNWLAAEADATLAPAAAAEARSRAADQLGKLIAETPEDRRSGLAALPEREALNVALP